MLPCRPRATLCLALLWLLALAAPASAQDPSQEAATEALEQVEALAAGQDVETGRELSPALLELAQSRSDLSGAQRRRANRIVARPTDAGDNGPGSLGPYTVPSTSSCTTHFCVHWVESSGDAPPGADGNPSTIPSYVETMKATFEQVYQVENGNLGWRAPLADAGRGGDDRVDVYVQNVGSEGIFGYASPDPQPTGRSLYSYLVMDDDYAEFGYPSFLAPLQVTAAHEYNHVLQYAYDSRQDGWMFESTATWSEEKVFDGVNDYVNYMDTWADLPEEPLTSAGDGVPANDDLKMYGSAIWNHWLERRYGAQVVRQAWAGSQANSVSSRGFAPGAYDVAIRDTCGVGFAYELSDFASAVAEWDSPDSGVREGSTFPREVARRASPLELDGVASTGTVMHTASVLYFVPGTSAAELFLTGGLPAGGTPGSIALVGHRADGSMTKSLGLVDGNGLVTVSVTNPSQFDRITAVATNASMANTGYLSANRDWNWSQDAQTFTLRASTTAPSEPRAAALPAFTPCPPQGPDPDPTPTATPTPVATTTATPAPTATPTPTPTPAPRTSLVLSRSTTKIRSAARTGVLALFARTNKAGKLTARSSVDRVTARRLKVGRRTTSTGTGRRTATAPSRLRIKVKLTRKARAALRRQKTRTLRIKVRVTFVPADGTRAVRRTISLLLRP